MVELKVKEEKTERKNIILRYDLCQAGSGVNLIWCQCEQRGCPGCAYSGLNLDLGNLINNKAECI